jgi:hypothetical protein
MEEQTAIYKTEKQDAQLMESVLLQGDLSKLTPEQRVNYYQKVCQSIGLNPLTRPFDYITLNGKLTLYAKKDATDQLRAIHQVSIDDVDITETDTHFVVKVKGHDSTGRTDVDLGVVSKTDMQNNAGNQMMKAVTKGKRRLTLSLCGLGWLDETEVETIPNARPVVVTENGDMAPMTYEEAADTTFNMKGTAHRLDEMTPKQLQWVVDNSKSFEKIEAAKVVLAHDHNQVEAEQPA